MENIETNESRFTFENCPSDILRLIFEAAVTQSEQGFKTATVLSHVSRHWRTISLSTPALWSYISLSTIEPLDATKQFLHRMCERIGAREVFLVIKDLLWEEIHSLQHLDLEKMTNMGRLKLQVAGISSQNADPLPKLLKLSGINLTKLDLIFMSDSQPGGTRICAIPSLFPNLQQLHIDARFRFAIYFKEIHIAIRKLSLSGVGSILSNLAQCFPGLESLELAGALSASDRTKELKFWHLKKLKIHRSASIGGLGSLLCPALAEFWCDEFSRLDSILTFIDINPSILKLTLKFASKVQQLAGAAPQLQHLTTRGLPKKFFSPLPDEKPLFPCLQTLTINESEFESLEEFEGLIRSRCLPVDHPKGELLEGCSRLEVLGVVLLENERLEDTILAESELLKEANVWIEEDETWDVREKMCMSWKS